MRALFLSIAFTGALFAHAQIQGDSVVCVGNIHVFSADMPGAVSYAWSYPVGWYDVSGQGTAQFIATCNLNAGDVCVMGMDSNGGVVGTACLPTQMGGGSHNLSVYPELVTGCGADAEVDVAMVIDAPTPGCAICQGTLHTNIDFAIYSGPQPSGSFLGFVGQQNVYAAEPSAYIYLIDHTNGTGPGEAIFLSGGCGEPGNFVVHVIVNSYQIPEIVQEPAEVCVGEEVTLTEMVTLAVSNCEWTVISPGVELPWMAVANPVTGLVTGPGAVVQFQAVDMNGCQMLAQYPITYCIGTGLEDMGDHAPTLIPLGAHRYRMTGLGPGCAVVVRSLTGAMIAVSGSSDVDLSSLSTGIYILEEKGTGGASRWKVVR